MTRTILTSLVAIAVSCVAMASAQACVVTNQPATSLVAMDHVFPHAAGAALRKEGELRGIQFLVSVERPLSITERNQSLLKLQQLDRAASEAQRLHRERGLNLVRLTAPDQLMDAGIAKVAGKLC
jgi:hypothetical protein